MLPEARKHLDQIMADREAQAQHVATVKRQLAEDRAARIREAGRRSVRGLTLSGIIRR